MQKRYFEIEMAHEPFHNGKKPENTYFMCIVGIKYPTTKEAEHFLEYDMNRMGYERIISVTEIAESDAYRLYDMAELNKSPVFGVDFPMSLNYNPDDFPLFPPESGPEQDRE